MREKVPWMEERKEKKWHAMSEVFQMCLYRFFAFYPRKYLAVQFSSFMVDLGFECRFELKTNVCNVNMLTRTVLKHADV